MPSTLRVNVAFFMRNILTNLLIAVSLGLCVLIWFQWVREGHSRQTIQKLTDTIHDKDEALQNLQGVVRQTQAEVARLEQRKNELTALVASNRLEIAQLTRDLDRANTELEQKARQLEAYKDALERANESIRKQNEDIKRQNEDLKQLGEERNEIVSKYNKIVAEFNDLAEKWNALQEMLKTNPPAGRAPPEKR